MDGKELVSEELRLRIEDLAREQRREPSEVLEDAVSRYAAECRLDRLQGKLGARAKKLSIGESDVPELVRQVRDENQRGR
jgi:hypothetical protein